MDNRKDMDNRKLNEIKDLVYEAEGLLELLQSRPEKLGDLARLIGARLDQASRSFAELCGDEEAATATPADSDDGYVLPDEDICPQPAAAPQPEPREPEPDDTPAPEPAPRTPQAPVTPKTLHKETPAFCLNDRFRFRRAIFGGSDAEFNSTMDYVASLDNYEEAEEYFLADMGLDPENEDVAAFMQIIKTYFGR